MPDVNLAENLSHRFFEELVGEFSRPHTVGFLLAGSFARRDAARHSDVDLMEFVEELPASGSDDYLVRFRNEHLVCVKVGTIAGKLAEFERPEKAIWAVPGIRQAVVLSDPKHKLSELKRRAEAFDWTSLQPLADLYAANELAGFSEEVHKLLNARALGDASAADYAVLGLLLGLTRVVAVKLGVMIPTENVYFKVAREAAGTDSGWTQRHERILGGGPPEERLAEALSLYLESAAIIGKVGNTADLDVIGETVRRIKDLKEQNS